VISARRVCSYMSALAARDSEEAAGALIPQAQT